MKFLAFLFAAILMTGCSKDESTVNNIIDQAKPIRLTAEQTAFVHTNRIVVGYQKNIHPVIFDTDGKPDGISAAYLKLIQKKTGMQFEYRGYDTNLDLVKGYLRGEFEVAAAANDIIERRSQVIISRPYMNTNATMLLQTLPLKFPMKVAVGSTYAIQESVAKFGTMVSLVPYPTDEESYKALVAREVGGVIMSQAVADYLEHKYNNAFARSPVSFTYHTGFGCQRTRQVVCDILTSGIDQTTPRERQVIERSFLVKPLEKIEVHQNYGTVPQ